MKHVYDIFMEFKSDLRVESINKECYLLNLDKKIMMFKRGYMVDQAIVNFQKSRTYLRYYVDKRVVFVAPDQIDMHNLLIDLNSNPPKISLKSTDSIVMSLDSEYVFMDVLRLETNKWVFFYQVPTPNLNGEVKYQFFMTMPWNFQEKVDSLLPKFS